MPASPGTLAWIDTADWKAVVPMRTPLDLTGSRLWGKVTPAMGGPEAATISSDDGSIFWDPAIKPTTALFVKIAKGGRNGWVAADRTGQAAQVTVAVDVHRYVTGSPDDEWLGRTYALVLPGSDSALVLAGPGTNPILISKQPESGILLPGLQIGPQGVHGAPGTVLSTYPVAITQDGQTVIPYPVQYPPLVPSTVHLIVNGEEYFAPDITVGASGVTWANPAFPLEKTDRVVLRYT